jgi:cytochrome c553
MRLALAVALALGTVSLWGPARVRAFQPEVNFELQCMGCHQRDGSGQPGRVPSLRRTFRVMSGLPQGREYVLRVPGVAQAPLSDSDLAALLNWMARELTDWGSTDSPRDYAAAEVRRARSHPLANVKVTRARVLRLLAHRSPDTAGSRP